ncbi:hypothetical protein ACFQPG_03415 [Sphingomonas sp. GCM10030256]|uniref:hypothetical protein n=1 Tax=Sphingomonas sp. GCM10030256 TaxID=3273427 RepID=UPI00361979C5
MSDKDKAAGKADRLAAKLRENLRRRKAQARELSADQRSSDATDEAAAEPES